MEIFRNRESQVPDSIPRSLMFVHTQHTNIYSQKILFLDKQMIFHQQQFIGIVFEN